MADLRPTSASLPSRAEDSAFADIAPRSLRRACLVVVDHFYRDATAVRGEALQLAFREHGRGRDGYTGLIATLDPALGVAAIPAIASALGVAVEFDPRTQGTIRCVTAAHYAEKVDDQPEDARHLGWLHYDGFDWTGVVSLCPPSMVRGCTSFWRHVGLGLDGFHDPARVRAVMRETGLTIEQLIAQVDRDLTDASCWREVARVEHAFNRLLLFRGEMFHVSSVGFGTSPLDCKMTQNFFIDEVADPSVPPPPGRLRVGPRSEHRGP